MERFVVSELVRKFFRSFSSEGSDRVQILHQILADDPIHAIKAQSLLQTSVASSRRPSGTLKLSSSIPVNPS